MTATRLTHVFRASVVSRNRPHATEALLFWGYISEDDIVYFLRRLSKTMTPEAIQRAGDSSNATFNAHRMNTAPNPFHCSHRPYGL